MVSDSSYGKDEDGKRGATRARAAATAVPWQGEARECVCVRVLFVLSCLVLSCRGRDETRRGIRACLVEVETRRDVAYAWRIRKGRRIGI
jgi:hypothetical protein